MADGILNPIEQLEADFDFEVYTKQEVDALLDEKADKSDTYTKTETDALLDDKADADAVYTKTETDTLLSAKADKSTTLAGYGITDAYTKTQTDNLLNGKADADDVYTKTEIDTKIPNSVGSATKPTYVNGGVLTECTYELNKTVPANAVFTDTTYSAGNGLNLSGTSFSAKAGTNVSVDGNGINVNGNGVVASADSGLINGGTAYTELRPTLDGTWVKNAQTTATNLQKLEGGIEYLYGLLSHQYDQLKKYINGNYYDYDTDSTSAYTKTVPQGAMPYASLDSIGGKTLVWNQLIENGNFADASGWTRENQHCSLSVANNVATVTLNTESQKQVYCPALSPAVDSNYNATVGHKYFVQLDARASYDFGKVYIRTNAFSTASILLGNNCVKNTWYTLSAITSSATSVNPICGYIGSSGFSEAVLNDTLEFRNFIIVDLTLMYGSGNEPSTVEEFQQMFPASYYPNNEGELLSAGVTEVVSKDSNNATLQTYSIPASIQALEGYGWSAGSVYNYVDFERKVFVKNVGKVVLDGTQTSTVYTFNESQCRVCYAVTNVKSKTTATVDGEILSDYLPNGNNIQSQAGTPCVFRRENGNSEIFVSLGSIGISAGITGVAGFNSYLSTHPLTVYYALATPTETDISEYLTDDNLINVEANGTLTFPNQNGTDYQIPVPSEEEYMINLQSALGE